MYLWRGIMTGWVSSWQWSRAGVWQPCVQSEASVQVTWLLLTNHRAVWPGQSLLRPWGQRPVAVHHGELSPTIQTFYTHEYNQYRGHFGPLWPGCKAVLTFRTLYCSVLTLPESLKMLKKAYQENIRLVYTWVSIVQWWGAPSCAMGCHEAEEARAE